MKFLSLVLLIWAFVRLGYAHGDSDGSGSSSGSSGSGSSSGSSGSGSSSGSSGSGSSSGSSEENCHVGIACENHSARPNVLPLDLSCSGDDEVLDIIEANYGRTEADPDVCPYNANHNNLVDCYAEGSLEKVKALCQDKSSCSVLATNDIFGDPCVGTYKYLQVNYCCNEVDSGDDDSDDDDEGENDVR